MMLRGTKPLAVFSEVDGAFVEPLARYLRLFGRHVEAGRLLRKLHIERCHTAGLDGRELHVVLFALPAERWRIEAMIDLRRRLCAWTADDERTEGSLLGYSDWQNDLWLAKRFGQT